MPKVYVSIGSNINRYQHITASLEALSDCFGELAISKVYESEAVGFEGDNFLNLVVGFECELSVGELSSKLRSIEHDNGRSREGSKFSSRTLDIDILTYGTESGEIEGISLPRNEITENAFVLLPLTELAADTPHPVLGASYSELWDAYDQARQKLWSINFNWRGKLISTAE